MKNEIKIVRDLKKIGVSSVLAVALTGIGFSVVPGFKLVKEVRAEQVKEVSDTWLQTKLVTTYALNRNLSVFDFDTNVKDQVVFLEGTVDSGIQKDLAGEIAKSIEGVRSVENKLRVEKRNTTQARATGEKSFSERIDDLTLTASVKAALLTNENVSGLDVKVTTERGTVQLNGVVANNTERELAEKLAENVDGVKDVDNNLEVRG